ncbi:biotin transporter BioY [Nocardioides sp. T2.26MG-1]|uniref:biotin transporter BioY n=1 Tax=Nocardioides sp. T2.26MG-1 TaxID=3041166 RepID=UPI0024776E58|nr:biotin transporter BioY [Nocardioides sp. T2.26MG-1]CAI9418866.1 Biotin transporter BioY [Nocardioides sp. T2.26MG-1]
MAMAETTDPTTTDTTDAPARRRSSTTDIALISAFAALIAACAYIGGIPAGGGQVPITLQTFGVMLAGALLGPWRGFLAVSLYLGLGAAGLPVFAEHSSGLGTFTSASAGYLWTFPVAALVTGLLVQYVAGSRRTVALWVFLCAVPGMVINHLAGAFGMKVFFDISWQTAFTWDAPYWLGDIVKILVVALVASEVHKAFPQLLRRG